jgi:hypothetical protein
MPDQIAPAPVTIEKTYKVPEAEGILDRLFYRKLGFWLAAFFQKLNMTPVGVTLVGGVFGLVAGHLYYYRDLRLNVIGMALHVFANALDNADGQLARMTGQSSRHGRAVDNLVDQMIFTNIYVHLACRCVAEGFSPLIFLLALAAGLSHGLQAAAADYFRNGFVYFVNDSSKPFESSDNLIRDYHRMSWRDEPGKKLPLALFVSLTRQQELIMPMLNRLRLATDREFSREIPVRLREEYRDGAQPMFKWWGLLMTNTRMLILFALLFIDRPVWFFWIELTLFNLLLTALLTRQSAMLTSLLKKVTARSLSHGDG